ncbi:MAG: thioredoxin domain-containing protein [Planctomycetes bacterium]|nr:thioredoxin domain-containing protein [Planctomycetota bacterium]
MPNRLATQSSPYLLQHQNNPVDWFPWGTEALERARKEDKPIFLSIGYSACHWCHVMEHESFENPEIAQLLNDSFVSIKVDREERPDLDHIYMAAVQAITGRGGWPMSVFLTPQGEPFLGGTYWPPTRRQGMPGFDEVLRFVVDLWHNRRPDAMENAGQLVDHLRQLSQPSRPLGELSVTTLTSAAASLERVFDFTYGGFGGAPKFPHPMDLQLLMRYYRRDPRSGLLDMVRKTLQQMARGGIYDHLGGGFHRYSVDERWLVPHFEKMLYDNALLARTYIDAFRLLGDEEFAATARETLDYLLREMQDKAGGFYSTQDADSEGVEGKFFVWTPDEIRDVLGDEVANEFCWAYDVTEAGNFEEQNILNLGKSLVQHAKLRGLDEAKFVADMAAARAKLLEVRNRRVHPGLDDKVLANWNGLAIDTLAVAAGALDEPRFLEAATHAAEFIWREMYEGRRSRETSEIQRETSESLLESEVSRLQLRHSWRQGIARGEAFLDDYASLIRAFVTLYEAGFDERWIDRAIELADMMLKHFADADQGGFFFTADDHEQLIARQKQLTDDAVPSGNGLAAEALLRLGRLTGRQDFLDAAAGTLRATSALMRDVSQAAGQMLLALDFDLRPSYELVLIGDASQSPTADVLKTIRQSFMPPHVVACRVESHPPEASISLNPLFEGRSGSDSDVTLYLCESFVCQEPVKGAACNEALLKLAAHS